MRISLLFCLTGVFGLQFKPNDVNLVDFGKADLEQAMQNAENYHEALADKSDGPTKELAKSLKKKCDWPKSWHSKSRSEEQFLYEYYFCQQKTGTYLEMGAVDGVWRSNTLNFEKKMGWKGVLIEASSAGKRIKDNRSPTSNAIILEAACDQENGKIEQLKSVWGENKDIPCSPLGSHLKKAGVKKLDFFVLDVEGNELAVLKTMDWNIPVGVFVIELSGIVKEEQGRKDAKHAAEDHQIKELLEQHGYVMKPGFVGLSNKIFEHPEHLANKIV